LRFDAVEPNPHRLALLEHQRQRIVAILGLRLVAALPEPGLDTLPAPPKVAFAGELRMQRELEGGQAIEGDARQYQLLACRLDQLGRVGDAIGLGDEPACDRVAVDAMGDVVVHARIIAQAGPVRRRYSAAASLWFCAAATLARARSSLRTL